MNEYSVDAKMDFVESTRLVLERIQKLDPDNAMKIIGYLLLRADGNQDIINLATGPDSEIQELIHEAKARLPQCALSGNPANVLESSLEFDPFSPDSPLTVVSPPGFYNWEPQVTGTNLSPGFKPLSEIQNNVQLPSLEEGLQKVNLSCNGFSGEFSYADVPFGSLGPRTRSRTDFPAKICHYFNKGFCKHGTNCRFFHGKNFDDLFQAEDYVLWSASLENLELEIVELLKSRRGNPISIASLPMLYYEKYGKVLQADGYLTESQRHGKAGFSLTKLLARLKNSIRLIDRPHGQHAVILAEDAPKYMDNIVSPTVSGSRQIYLTFPSESTFSEEDVSKYFSSFGVVEDVRIPCQQKRMFGFVTFASSDTVKTILANGNPHFVCGTRVLVKPYREKSRKFQDRIEPFYQSAGPGDICSEFHLFPGDRDTSRMLRGQFMEAENTMELERRRFTGLQVLRKPMFNPSYLSWTYRSRESKDYPNIPSAEGLDDIFGFLNVEDNVKPIKTGHNNQESDGINLPESPFSNFT